MKSAGFWIFFILFLLFTLPIISNPIFFHKNREVFLSISHFYSFSCHQLTSRSFCYLPEESAIVDCPKIDGRDFIISFEGKTYYKFPVCARCLFIYLGILFSSLFFLIKKERRESTFLPPPILFILALIPIGLDGVFQFFGFWESTNLIRAITGFIAGFATSFYAIPLLNGFFSKD